MDEEQDGTFAPVFIMQLYAINSEFRHGSLQRQICSSATLKVADLNGNLCIGRGAGYG